jgi:hypothetical protein
MYQVDPLANRPSWAFTTRLFPSHSCEGFSFIENYLDTSTDLESCQCFRKGISKVDAIEFGLIIDVLLRMETTTSTACYIVEE